MSTSLEDGGLRRQNLTNVGGGALRRGRRYKKLVVNGISRYVGDANIQRFHPWLMSQTPIQPTPRSYDSLCNGDSPSNSLVSFSTAQLNHLHYLTNFQATNQSTRLPDQAQITNSRLIQRYLQDHVSAPKSWEVFLPEMIVDQQKLLQENRFCQEQFWHLNQANVQQVERHANVSIGSKVDVTTNGSLQSGSNLLPSTSQWSTEPKNHDPAIFKKRRAWEHHLKCWSDQTSLESSSTSGPVRAQSSPNPSNVCDSRQPRRRSLCNIPQAYYELVNQLEGQPGTGVIKRNYSLEEAANVSSSCVQIPPIAPASTSSSSATTYQEDSKNSLSRYFHEHVVTPQEQNLRESLRGFRLAKHDSKTDVRNPVISNRSFSSTLDCSRDSREKPKLWTKQTTNSIPEHIYLGSNMPYPTPSEVLEALKKSCRPLDEDPPKLGLTSRANDAKPLNFYTDTNQKLQDESLFNCSSNLESKINQPLPSLSQKTSENQAAQEIKETNGDFELIERERSQEHG